ncbi:GreA/GreB family elongation factor [Miltoncostaea marina]|uniref:GreA/GreB family elongation factor n=1 Tax=Miltoncostaea marina TaxID=2843215 RepID=UPI001C3DEB82|nr:GreA/GreB family elongation factor [Miltoncostaea marina]
MSKAFVNEDAAGGDASGRLPARPADPQPITPRGLAELREELAELDGSSRRAHVLEQILETVEVREPELEDGRAGFGCVVDVERGTGALRRYELAGPDEADPRAGRISVASPLGEALSGRRAGDVVAFAAPAGEERIRVLEVSLPGDGR